MATKISLEIHDGRLVFLVMMREAEGERTNEELEMLAKIFTVLLLQ